MFPLGKLSAGLMLGLLLGGLAKAAGPGNLGPPELMPMPKVAEVQDKAFEKVRKSLHLALADGRVGDILDLSVDQVALPDDRAGMVHLGVWLREALVRRKAGESNLVEEMQKALEAGCGVSREGDLVLCPGFSRDFPLMSGPGSRAIVWGRYGSVFRQPYDKSRLLDEVNGVQIPLCETPHEARGYYCVQIPGKPRGYVRSSEAWLSHGIRLAFVRDGGLWKLAQVRGTWPLLPEFEAQQWEEGP